MKFPHRGSLVWSLVAIAVVQAALLVAVFVGVGVVKHGAASPPPPSHDQGPRPPPPPGPPPGAPRGPHHGPPGPESGGRFPSPADTIFLGGLVILGIGAILTGRWIVRPVRDLARTVRAFGQGDLRARSELRRADELGDLARAFDEMAARVEALVRAEKELLANVSHELRTPLARVRVALDIAAEAEGASASPLSEVEADLAELETIIDDVMTTARLDVDRGTVAPAGFALHLEDTEPAFLCKRAADRFRSRHPARPFELSVEEGAPHVTVDRTLVRRVIDNLLENAHKYSPEAGAAIVLRASRRDDRVELAVEDHGVGIAQDDLARLFTPFFRADRSRTRGTGGVGLGLFLAKRIVEAHGGSIAVESRAGQGTTVRVILPELGAKML